MERGFVTHRTLAEPRFRDGAIDPNDRKVGGCYLGKLGDGSGSYQWYYSDGPEPMTRDEVIADCESDEGTFVDWFPFDVDADDFGPPE